MDVKNIENDLREYYNAIGRCDHHKTQEIERKHHVYGWHHNEVLFYLTDIVECETGEKLDLNKVLS